MVLQDLNVGAGVMLEVLWGEKKIEVPTKVVGKSDAGTMIAPFVYNGVPLELDTLKNRDMEFHLYGYDSMQKRVAWKNVMIETYKTASMTAYIVKVNNFRRLAVDGERRKNRRIPLEGIGGVLFYKNGERSCTVTLHDISDTGIAFWLNGTMELSLEGNLTINFEDQVRDHRFYITVSALLVRSVEKDGKILVGCKFSYVPKDTLVYVYLKKVEYEAYLANPDE